MDMTTLLSKMIRAATLDISLYEEVERDEAATMEALVVVTIVAVASGIGAARKGPGNLVGGFVTTYVGWVIFAFLTYLIGTNLFRGTATFGEMLRTIGFASSPGVLSVLTIVGIVPCLGTPVAILVSLVVWVWRLVTTVVAVRQALDFDMARAVLTCILGWLLAFIIQVLVL